MSILAIGEVLIDHFPDYHQVAGAPLNFACHLKKLGQAVRLVSRIGADADGHRHGDAVADGLGLAVCSGFQACRFGGSFCRTFLNDTNRRVDPKEEEEFSEKMSFRRG